ncbi:MAG: hypothetical protein ALECFALPRED_007222 [Alectoria fallacina]|uniref:Uncharacterized protein n=1 Tax=Alectoria fallacina TaxID=1903189 RepID=A0A8H3IAL9_9LECA|nr:MAG: hypothetical protein ALECFALPRED_007222 [Alectoria fallacina]
MPTNDPLIPRQNAPHVALHAVELDESAALALQVIEHARQRLELRPAPRLVRTVIDLLHMRRALQMATQVAHGSELAAAEIALVRVAIPGVVGRPGLPVPFQEVVRDDAVSIALSQGVEDALTVDAACVWASAVFEVMRDAAGGSEGSFTKGTRDIGAAMGAGVEVLGGVLSARMIYK